jgi:hypothetical protein
MKLRRSTELSVAPESGLNLSVVSGVGVQVRQITFKGLGTGTATFAPTCFTARKQKFLNAEMWGSEVIMNF